MRRPLLALAAVLAAGSLAATAETAERARYLMGSACRIVAGHDEPGRAAALIEEAFDEIDRWNGVLSDWDQASELSRMNATAAREPFACSEELFGWLSRSLEAARETGGAFDPTVGALVDLYGLRQGGRWPSEEELQQARRRTGHALVRLDPERRTVRFAREGVRLDPGGNGKGLALDAAAAVLRAGGVRWALLDFGGQILALGGGPEGRGFPVELPGRGGAPGRTILLKDASVATTSNSQRGLEVDGRPLGHILDPRSAEPSPTRGSLTVLAGTAERADALSTALFVLGPGAVAGAPERFGVEAIFSTPGEAGDPPRASAGFPAPSTLPTTGAAPAAPDPTSHKE